MLLTDREKAFIKQLFEQISIKPSAPDAMEMVGLVQSITVKLNEKEERVTGNTEV